MKTSQHSSSAPPVCDGKGAGVVREDGIRPVLPYCPLVAVSEVGLRRTRLALAAADCTK